MTPRAKKRRDRVPPEVAAAVLVAANRTCCKCRLLGKPVQIHHIDDNPANNSPANLAVLCFDCHNETLVRGGFGRQLDAEQVREFRDDWNRRVQHRYDEADRLAATAMSGVSRSVTTSLSSARLTFTGHAPRALVSGPPPVSLDQYVVALPNLRRRAFAYAQADWNTGTTAGIVEGCNKVIALLEEVLTSLTRYYPAGHFERENPREYISEQVAARSSWHYSHAERSGRGKDGTFVHVLVARAVLADVERMVAEMVHSLTFNWEASSDLRFAQWESDWFNPRPFGRYGMLRERTEPEGQPKIKWGCYQFNGDDKLYCIKCYETERRKHPTTRVNSQQRQCAVCQTVVFA